MARKKNEFLPKDKLQEAYRGMKTIREFEERLYTEVNNGRLGGFYHLSCGQEASAVGVSMHLNESDLYHHQPSWSRALYC